MTRVIVDPATRAKLINVRKPLELCDESGMVLGHFVPALGLPHGEFKGPQVDEQELDRREREGGGRSLASILADLKGSQ